MPATHRRLPPLATVLPGAALCALALSAVTPTLAHANPSATVSPVSVAPGQRIALNVTGCGTKTGRASSRAFGEVQLTPGNLEAANLFGGADVLRTAAVGSHPVTFECGGPGGTRVTVPLTVIAGGARGGTGGSVGSTSTGQIAVGGALVASALGAGVWVMRRRAEAAA
ncbi:hypothetical protein OHS33_10965 [Streptomyces sp. NBC_00536]|uniref:hypothetical protein n=1 Tax=Streptomyces sp. NBC_00536 TaxID=2975769 RepID=UPI002E808066|nr:hypothetical protein [Streptomyces sp. NBC_00536]WUC78813.1 hypothetical protein OHS33_10965 [Streptomyces sp. NBC_00536]